MNRLHRRGAGAAVSLGLVACAGGQSGTEGDPTVACQIEDSRTVSADDATELGTPRERAAAWLAEERSLLTWSQPRGSTLAQTVLTTGVRIDLYGARLVKARRSQSTPGACPDYLAFDGVLAFETADGAFHERIGGVFKAFPSAERSFEGALPAGSLVGSYDVAAIIDDYRHPSFGVELFWLPIVSGSVFIRERDEGVDAAASPGAATLASFVGDASTPQIDAGRP